MIYGARSNGNQHGLVITKPAVVEAMLDRVGYVPSVDLRAWRVIEPAAGDGAFAGAIVARLYASSVSFGFSFQAALSNLAFFEIDADMATALTHRMGEQLATYGAALPDRLVRVEDFLLAKAGKCDLVIGNPPYVRHEQIPEPHKQRYRKAFSTFRHRSDLYIAFYERGLQLLDHQGTLSFICANRWLKNQYGKKLRGLVHLAYALEEVIDLERACPFEEDVLAYPAITTIRRTAPPGPARYYSLDTIEALSNLDEGQCLRTLATANPQNWFPYVKQTTALGDALDSIENQGFKIGIGVATGADSIFIRRDFEALVEPDRLMPILMAKDLRQDQFRWSGTLLLNPFDQEGRLIDLDQYPKTKAYLEAERAGLDKRYVAKKNPRFWYKTIDRVYPELREQEKILLPDITGNRQVFIDRGDFYPHHNLYYITGRGYSHLVILAAILMSDFVRDQLSELGTKMHGGYPRWQSQNLKKLRIPRIEAMPAPFADALSQAYHAGDHETLNALMTEANIRTFSLAPVASTLFG